MPGPSPDRYTEWLERQSARLAAAVVLALALLQLAAIVGALVILGLTIVVVVSDPQNAMTGSSVAPITGLVGFGLSLVAWAVRRRAQRVSSDSESDGSLDGSHRGGGRSDAQHRR